jgi:hypothetical protein
VSQARVDAILTGGTLRLVKLDLHGHRQEYAVLGLWRRTELARHPSLDAQTLSIPGQLRIDREVHSGERRGLVREVVLDQRRIAVDDRRGGIPADDALLCAVLRQQLDHGLMERHVEGDLLVVLGVRDSE